MPSYGGFYISPTEWKAWVTAQNITWESWGVARAEAMMEEKMNEGGIRRRFGIDIIPALKAEPREKLYALVLYRRRDKRVRTYLPPRSTVQADLDAKRLLEAAIGLRLSDWKTIWYDGEALDPDSEIVEPSDQPLSDTL
ncbi:hypothetical protein FRC06_004068 [Ceratobasidium sp. 370]|nr:hypothetical protein FRC06_004068 [Ceratobasidium sp. 370]